MSDRFTGKVVVITGAAGGIGQAAAVRFASEGAHVVAVDVDPSQLDATMDLVNRPACVSSWAKRRRRPPMLTDSVWILL